MKRWTEEEIEKLVKLYGNVPYQEVYAEFPDRSQQSVNRKASNLGIAPDRSTKAKLQGVQHLVDYHKGSAPINHSFFNVPNQRNCYWAGFIAADGCIDDKRGRVTIGLATKDQKQLAQLLLDSDGKIKIGHSPKRNKVTLHIYSSQWIYDLQTNFNIHPRKSLTITPPYLTGKKALAFIVGYIDGDGSFYKQTSKGIDYLKFKVVGTKEMMQWMAKQIGIERYSMGRYSSITELCYFGNFANELRVKLGGLDVPYMERKWGVV